MSYYKISFDQLRREAEMSGLLDAVQRGFEKFDVDFFLVGALARDTWMGLNNKQPKRTTADVDFAILIPDTKTFTDLKGYLIKEEGFNPYHGNSFVLLWEDGTQVDLLPFGDIEDNGSVHVEGTGYTTIHVDGFREVYDEGLPEMELESGNRFKFCSLPGIVLLKLIAWDDRPEMRRKDILDISDILNHYFDIDSDNIYENHSELFLDEKAELMDIGATVLGREMGEILKRNTEIATRVNGIIEDNIKDQQNSRIGNIMTEYFDNAVEDNIALLTRILSGINENKK
jgi:predicted nucleotidyltransferase